LIKPNRSPIRFLFSVAAVLVVAALYLAYRWFGSDGSRTPRVLAFLRNPQANAAWTVQSGERCGEAPFIMPTSGFIGFLWDDSFRPGHRHQGLDIFGGQDLNQTPVVAAYSGYLTRLADWKSSLIIRIPDDPLRPGRQIWTYYTHMADPDGNSFISPQFPPGTHDLYVEAGALLGYQGNYSGDPFRPAGIHLHFSIVLDDGQGSFRNELEIQNTLDPSPYLGLPVNAKKNRGEIPVCMQEQNQ
jgi:peptidoglycan LD-endopeptidase LytH